MVGQILGAATQVGASIYGAIKSSEANKRAEQLIQNQRDENKKWYDQKMAEDYMQRSEVQNVLRKQRDLLQEQYKRARATNLVAGGTDESLALQQQAANQIMGDTMGNIAANASAYKDSVEQQYRSQDAALNQQQIGVEQARANSIAQAAGQVGRAVSGLMTGAGMPKTTNPDEAKAAAAKDNRPILDNTKAYTGSDLDNALRQYEKAQVSKPVPELGATKPKPTKVQA